MKTKIKKVLTGLTIVSLIAISFGSLNAQANDVVMVFGEDVKAGEEIKLRTGSFSPNEAVVFGVLDPNGKIVEIDSSSNSSGIAYATLSGFHTKKSGKYHLALRKKTEGTYRSAVNSFYVYPGSVAEDSSVFGPENLVKNVGEKVTLKVQLMDDYGNKVVSSDLRLLTGNEKDGFVELENLFTDNFGEVEVSFKVNFTGLKEFRVYDAKSRKMLDDRVKILGVYDEEEIYEIQSVQGTGSDDEFIDFESFELKSKRPNAVFASDYVGPAIGAAAGPFEVLRIEDIPNQAEVGEPITFDVTAYDANDQVVTNYDGTVRFSVLGDNAGSVVLPNDYTYDADDLGSHTFTLAITFQNPGNYVLEVRDVDETNVFATQLVEVVSGSAGSNEDDAIVVSNPSSGTYSNNIQVFQGTAEPGSNLRILDNNIEIASLIADASGGFSYTTAPLTEGVHSFQVVSVNDIGTVIDSSETIQVNIDNSSPEIEDFALTQGDGETVFVQLYTAEQLSSAEVIFDGDLYEMNLDDDGVYKATVPAPSVAGDYPLTIVLTDELGNEARFDDYQTVTIEEGNLDFEQMEDEEDEVTQDVVGPVRNLIAIPDDGKITLNWVPPLFSTNDIEFYRVFYGTSEDELNIAVDTLGTETNWFVPNLENGIRYYFGVAAVDSKGQMSSEFGNVVSEVPESVVVDVVPPEVDLGIGGGEALVDMEEDVADAGLGLNAMIALFGVVVVYRFYFHF